jgi:ABC-type glutathione transport system ATPase component
MVFVTHDSTVARRAQRIGVMKNGRLTFKQRARTQAARSQAARTTTADPAPSGLDPDNITDPDNVTATD